MRILHSIIPLLLLAALSLASCATPAAPVWPSYWSSSVRVSSPVLSSLFGPASNPVSYTGTYYYANKMGTAFHVRDTVYGASTQFIVQPGNNATQAITNTVNGQACQALPVVTGASLINSLTPFIHFPPNFLTVFPFVYAGVTYRYRENAYFSLDWWRFDGFNESSPFQVNYFHSRDLNIPYRMEIGYSGDWSLASYTPAIIEFSNDFASFPYEGGFGDSTGQFFQEVPNCSVKPSAPPAPPAQAKNQKFPLSQAWPAQFHASATFTGNDYGFQGEKVQVSLRGNFYYDSTNNRECNIWADRTSGERTKTVIVDGAFHAIDYNTGACVEPPVPITGSLHSNWTQNLEFWSLDSVLRGEVVNTEFYAIGEHFGWDAFHTGSREHAFQYWQLSGTGEPMIFQGPVVDVAPYFQSFSQWALYTIGLADVNSTDIYSVPSNCRKLGSETWKFIESLEKMKSKQTREDFLSSLMDISQENPVFWSEFVALNEYFPISRLYPLIYAHSTIFPQLAAAL